MIMTKGGKDKKLIPKLLSSKTSLSALAGVLNERMHGYRITLSPHLIWLGNNVA